MESQFDFLWCTPLKCRIKFIIQLILYITSLRYGTPLAPLPLWPAVCPLNSGGRCAVGTSPSCSHQTKMGQVLVQYCQGQFNVLISLEDVFYNIRRNYKVNKGFWEGQGYKGPQIIFKKPLDRAGCDVSVWIKNICERAARETLKIFFNTLRFPVSFSIKKRSEASTTTYGWKKTFPQRPLLHIKNSWVGINKK